MLARAVLRLSVALLARAMVLIVVRTIAQTRRGLCAAVDTSSLARVAPADPGSVAGVTR